MNGNDTIENPPFSPLASFTISTVMTIIIFVTVFGNLIVIIFFCIDSKIRKSTSNLYLLNLACADLLVGIFSLPLNTSWVLHDYWPHGEIVCKLWVVVDYVACFESCLSIILISLDRYLLVTQEIRYDSETKQGTSVSCQRESETNTVIKPHTNAKHLKAAKTLTILVGVFLLCWAPYN
ncbi:histamine H3 receptor-like, partial [Saccoglossus kowalevskii]